MTTNSWLHRIDELAEEHGDIPALRAIGAHEMTLSWAELAGRSMGITDVFAQCGVEQGTTVCVELRNGAAHVLATIAAWGLGATVLPLRPALPPPERERLLELARPSLVVREHAEAAGEISEETMLAVPPASGRVRGDVPVASPAWMLASGGSTGAPKLIAPAITTEIGSSGMGLGSSAGLQFADNSGHRHPTNLVCGPLYHMQAFALLHRTLLDDYRNVIMERFDAEVALDLMESEQVALVAMVPTMLVRLLRSPTIGDRDLSHLECVVHGGAACPDWVTRGWIDLIGGERFLLGYGMSEGIGAALIRGDEWLEHPGSVGKPANCEVLVVDEDGRPVPTGELGEIFLRPAQPGEVFRYVGDATIRCLDGGYMSVGDLGWVDDEGYLYIADRRTDMIVTGGANVFVAEVESVLLAHPAVEDAVVIGLDDPEWGRRVHAIVQLREDEADLDVHTVLRAHCKRQLAGYKVPRTFEIVATIERSDAGKVNRRALAEARNLVEQERS